MEAQQIEKPRVKFADFMAGREPVWKEGTVAWVIQRVIEEMNGADGKRAVDPLGKSHQYTLERMQRLPIGAKDAFKLTEDDIVDLCKMLIETVCAATVNQYVGYLHGALKYARGAWRDCKAIPANVIPDVRKFLVKNGYIGKSIPRKRVPLEEEIAILKEYLSRPPTRNLWRYRITAMPDILEFALRSTRRLAEIMRIERGHIDWEHKDEDGNPAPLYHVVKMKHPKKKDYSKWFPLYPDLAEILLRQPKLTDDPHERFFPYAHTSVGAKYSRAKKELRDLYPGLFINLRFHDCRRRGITERLKKMTPHQVRHFYSGHEGVKMIESNYDATDPADGFAVVRQQQAA